MCLSRAECNTSTSTEHYRIVIRPALLREAQNTRTDTNLPWRFLRAYLPFTDINSISPDRGNIVPIKKGTKIGPYQLCEDIKIKVMSAQAAYIAATLGDEINMSGDSKEEAVQNLLLFMEDLAEDYLSDNDEPLGPTLLRRRNFLIDVLTK